MGFFEALLLGLVEGLTEFLPVSSTGHLLLVQEALGIQRDQAADSWAICVQAGAILAVLGLYPARCKQVVSGFLGGDRAGRAAVRVSLEGGPRHPVVASVCVW